MEKTRLPALALSLGLIAWGVAPANAAPVIFSGIDNNGSADTPLATTPNSDAARDAFFANLVGVGTETFESITPGSGSPLAISFGSAGTATLTGPGAVEAVTPGTTNGNGRYSVPSPTSSHHWDTDANLGGFLITFSNPVAAFGFYGIDLGDFQGTLTLRLTAQGGGTTDLPVPTAPQDVADGSVLYFGFFDTVTQYTSVAFITTGGTGDFFGFDNFSIGSIEQVRPVPAPAALAVLALGLVGLAAVRRRA